MAFKIGLALGGGGVRGLASIGVLRALDEAGIKPAVISGTSMGAIVGAIYADNTDIDKTEETIKTYLNSEEFLKKAHRLSQSSDMDKGFLDRVFGKAKKGYFFYRFLLRKSIVSPEIFFLELDQIIPDKPFADLLISFACVALDLASGMPEILHSGSIQDAVRASSAVPGILPPVRMGNRVYVDGGWTESVPAAAARALGADFVIGVDVSREILPVDFDEDMKNSMDIMFRADDIARSMMNTMRTREADFVVHPRVGSAEWSDFDNLENYISAGYRAAEEVIPSLKKALLFSKIKGLLWMRS